MTMLKIKFNDEYIWVDSEDTTNVEAHHYVKNGTLLVMRNGLPYTHKSSWESIAQFVMSEEGQMAVAEAMLLQEGTNGLGGGRINKLIEQDTRGKCRS